MLSPASRLQQRSRNLLTPMRLRFPSSGVASLTSFPYLVIIIPFHQGAVRHLYATYVEAGGSTRIKQGALAFDFLLLFFQACLFVAMSLLIDKTELFVNILIGLLVVDCVWGLLAYLAFTGAQAQLAEKKWALINLFAVVALFLIAKFGPPLLGGWNDTMQQIICMVCMFRTIIDYITSWSFYYPQKEDQTNLPG
jgi:hypothetical protein